MKPTIIFTVGPPGAGKSTYAEALAGPDVLRLERDRFREAIFGSRRSYHDAVAKDRRLSFMVGSTMFSCMSASLQERLHNTIIISDTNIYWDAVKRFHTLAQKYGAKVIVALFPTPLDALIERNETRPEEHRVPVDVITKMHQDLGQSFPWWKNSGLVDEVKEFS
jgi:predicted kinase